MRSVVASLALVVTMGLPVPVCQAPARLYVECYETGSACRDQPCIVEAPGVQGWGSDGDRCKPPAHLCKAQFRDTVTNRYVSVYRPACFFWCQ